jgi:hypothetical protein
MTNVLSFTGAPCLMAVSSVKEKMALLELMFEKRKWKFRKTFEKMEGFSFVKPVTGLNGPNTGKEDDET